jgi:hypothetical protein
MPRGRNTTSIARSQRTRNNRHLRLIAHGVVEELDPAALRNGIQFVRRCLSGQVRATASAA